MPNGFADIPQLGADQITCALYVAMAMLVLISFAVLARPGRIIAKPLMTGNELQFYRRLVRAATAQGLVVLCQVGMAALLTHAGVLGKAMWRLRSRFDRLIVDYVVYDPAVARVVAIIELDDKFHCPRKDARRDKMTFDAGYGKTIRYQSRSKPSAGEIAETLKHYRATLK